jgi:uncharacterized phage protein (TIGR01671 family)
MREIRFRAWDTQGYWVYPKGHPKREFIQKMYYDVEYVYDSCEGEYTPGARSFGHLLDDKRFIVMQYTGLKDKNNKEIYEGDICEMIIGNREICVKANNGDLRGFLVKIEIKYLTCGWIHLFPELTHPEDRKWCAFWDSHDEDFWDKNYFKVIGNIYENPELLK